MSKASAETVLSVHEAALRMRYDLIEMIGVGRAGHLGGSASLAEIVAALYFRKMRFDPANPRDPDRDRIILSKGHAVLIQYAALTELGMISRGELQLAKTLSGRLQGHPDMAMTPGIEAVTGSLGQGLSIGLGMALALRLDGRPCRVYVIMGDGELAEGQIWEAAIAARHYRVGNLVGIVDRNRIQATGPTAQVLDIPRIEEKWAAFGWRVLTIDGHDPAAILEALDEVERFAGGPSVIVADTVKGKGFSFAENDAAYHNATLTEELRARALADLDSRRAELARLSVEVAT